MSDFDKFEKIFENYVDKYIENSKDDTVKVLNLTNKKIHSYKVRENILKIAEEENLKLDMFILKFIGLFHDIGRFYQYDKYETFNDAKSQDHAKLSIKVLEDEGIIQLVDYDKRPYIVDAILMHNVKEVPKIEDRKMYLYVSLLRDADKLDGFRSICESEKINKNLAYFKDKSDQPIISDYVYEGIKNHMPVDKYYLKTILESQIVPFGYITSDIVFDTTLKIIKENDYTKRMFEKIQDTERSRDIYDFVNKYIDRRLNGEKE